MAMLLPYNPYYKVLTDKLSIKCKELFQDFIYNFKGLDFEFAQKPIYLDKISELVDPERNTLFIDFVQMEKYSEKLCRAIHRHYNRLNPVLCNCVKSMVQQYIEKSKSSVKIHPSKEFHVAFTNMPSTTKLRELSSISIGSLVQITAQVVRTHPVHPELINAYFICVDCNTHISQVPQQFKYTQPTVCINSQCANRSRFTLDLYRSSFADFQRIRVQECQQELPQGAVPRTLDVILRGEMVETAQAGDKCTFVGCLIALPDVSALSTPGVTLETYRNIKKPVGDNTTGSSGVQGLRESGVRDLKYTLGFLASSCSSSSEKQLLPEGSSLADLPSSLPDNIWTMIYKISTDKNLVNNLMNCLFPSIYGCAKIKLGILLQLFGGVPKSTIESTSLRGDINICIVGDPSTAKSQFLKQLSDFAPRSVYTSGKASSAAGLTAAVIKDEDSFEFVIEAGALMLADNGICCIDEFDKMDRRDQIAIHEAMEQQTISITKAGVKATLKARTSILAAANPIGGRYNKSKTLRQNITLSDAIMSRFDLFFVLIDDCNELIDYSVAEQVVKMHMGKLPITERVYTFDDIRTYIAVTRMFNPKLTPESSRFIMKEFLKLRRPSNADQRYTVRQLESVVRLSEATARMYCSDEVTQRHVMEAINLIATSAVHVDNPDICLRDLPSPTGSPYPNLQTPVEDSAAPVSIPLRPISKLTYEEYDELTRILMNALQKLDDDNGPTQIRRDDLVIWYLEQIQDQITTEEEFKSKKELTGLVIDRMYKVDCMLIALQEEKEVVDSEGNKRFEMVQTENPMIVIHPNYDRDQIG